MKMMIQCGCCGLMRLLSLEGTVDQIEARMNKMIAEEGWRWVKKWDGYVCGDCRKKGYDPLYEVFAGRPKASSKETSYVKLLDDLKQHIWKHRDT